MSHPSGEPKSSSHARAIENFDGAEAAVRYRGRLDGTPRDRREKRCIAELLREVPQGAHVLDLPCGTGRLTTFLVERGYRVSAADSSADMARAASEKWTSEVGPLRLDPDLASFRVEDAAATSFDDEAFDAVVCNRLFHHLCEPDTRIRVLRELARIASGPLIVSFFDARTLSAVWRAFRDRLRRRRPIDRIPIPRSRLRAEARAAGLEIDRVMPTRRGISPQTYVRLRRSV